MSEPRELLTKLGEARRQLGSTLQPSYGRDLQEERCVCGHSLEDHGDRTGCDFPVGLTKDCDCPWFTPMAEGRRS